MSPQYCPDCGEQCHVNEKSCHECSFPLVLNVEAVDNTVTISGKDLDSWKRISRLLQRNGLSVATRKANTWKTSQVWWALPSFGAIVLLATLLFGGELVDRIWEPPPLDQRPVLNMDNPTGERTNKPEDVDTGDISSLHDALRTSDDQRRLTSDHALDLNLFVDKPKVTVDVIRDYLREASLRVTVKDTKGWATLLDDRGYFLMEAALNAGAFKRETLTVSSKGKLEEKTVFIVPMARRPGEEAQKSERVVPAGHLTIELMYADLNYQPNYKVDFETQMGVGQKVWICHYLEGVFYPEIASITGNQQIADSKIWTLNSEWGASNSGSPIFDEAGNLAGIFLSYNGLDSALSLRTIREHAPLIYKEVK